MENQTRFDLNAALENWRTELAAQPNLSADDRRELETHLCDTFAGLKSRGLNEEESFWLARRRVGQPQKLAEEFVKADPTLFWRERVFWMASALLVYSSWAFLTDTIAVMIINGHWFGLNPFVSGSFLVVFRLVPLGWFAVWLLKGRADQNSNFASFFRSRRKVAIVPVALIVLRGWRFWHEREKYMQSGAWLHSNPIWLSLIALILWPVILTALTLWLLPVRNCPAQKLA